jgi:hypothetical protein
LQLTNGRNEIDDVGKQVIVDNEFLLVLAEEKSSEDSWHLNALCKRLRERLANRSGTPNFEVTMSQVGRSREKLSKDGFIEVKESQASREEGVSIETVELTLWGLFRVLEHIFVQETPTDEVLRETLDRIAESQTEKLPLIFKKWRYFSNLGMQEKVIGRLRSYFHFFPEGSSYHDSIKILSNQLEHKPMFDTVALINRSKTD